MPRAKIRNKRKSRQPKLEAAPPRIAERMYVGLMQEWSSGFGIYVLKEILDSTDFQLKPLQDELAHQKFDAKEKKEPNWFTTVITGLGARVLLGLRRKLNEFRQFVFGGRLERVGQEVGNIVKQQTVRVLGVKPEQISVNHQIETWVHDNVQYIRGLEEEKLLKIEQIIGGSVGQDSKTIAAALLKELDLTAQRAKFIAVDQTMRLNALMTQDAHKQLGIRRYKWRDRNDANVRGLHRELNARSLDGETFEYDNPPVAEENGDRYNPGEKNGCRCFAQPVIEEV